MRDEEYDPTTCPAAGCDYEDAIRSVAAHISTTDDDRHSWDNLVFDGARDFVIREKRRQQDGATNDQNPPNSPPMEVGSSPKTESIQTPTQTPDPDEIPQLDLGFARDALVLLDLARQYDADSLTELDTFRLVNLYTLLSDVSRGADDARKEVRDALLGVLQDDRRISSDFGSVKRYTTQRRNQKDEEVIRAELNRAGIDPDEARSFDTKKLKELAEERGLDESAVFDREERTYVKKSSADGDGRRRAFEKLDPELRSLIEEW
ncbi:hypothetical protein SAMN05421858_0011 [Haladaptatus litoreus]|uniref:Uncharacterized protein n=1 Tax=Haladaptatus litoreus TaxID=553468 RepID=A0A1N6UM42_9EURY|nr:hypothetical protein [Haladaptatus litoreus]SIQ66602.1 hypothetical protein SAMN05421858_0011 [Haladaptatus litoreus]